METIFGAQTSVYVYDCNYKTKDGLAAQLGIIFRGKIQYTPSNACILNDEDLDFETFVQIHSVTASVISKNFNSLEQIKNNKEKLENDIKLAFDSYTGEICQTNTKVEIIDVDYDDETKEWINNGQIIYQPHCDTNINDNNTPTTTTTTTTKPITSVDSSQNNTTNNTKDGGLSNYILPIGIGVILIVIVAILLSKGKKKNVNSTPNIDNQNINTVNSNNIYQNQNNDVNNNNNIYNNSNPYNQNENNDQNNNYNNPNNFM